jgi:hypothetical protein
MPSAVLLPNGRAYTLLYNSCGLLQQISYPSGGYTRYDYTVQSFLMVNAASPGAYKAVPENEVAHRYVCPAAAGVGNSCSVSEEVTTYSPVANNTANNSAMTVVHPLGNKEVYAFSQGNPAPFSGVQGVETSRTFYDASGTFLKSVQTQYAPNCRGIVPAPSLPTTQTTQLDNGMVAQTQWTYDCYFPGSGDAVLTEEQVYDYGQGTPGPLLKVTDYTWLHRDKPSVYGWPTNSGGANILNRKTSEVVHDGSGNLIAQTTFGYDYGAPETYGARGNMTSVSRWRNTDKAWLTTQRFYDAYGNLAQVQDANGNPTTYSYSDNYSDGVNRNSNAFLTKTTYANGASTQSQYNWGGGRAVATCGENFSGTCVFGASSAADYAAITYDVMARKTSVVTVEMERRPRHATAMTLAAVVQTPDTRWWL